MGVGDSNDNYYDDSFHQATVDWAKSGGMDVNKPRLDVYRSEPKYETPLTPEEEPKFQEWKAKNAPNDTGADYDLRGAFKADITPDPERGHLPDTFKKPNHPTFSDQSQYHGMDDNVGGTWGNVDGQDTFTPGATNLKNHTPEELGNYFKEVEPNAKLLLPRDSSQDIKVNPWITITPEDIEKSVNIGLSAGPGTMMGVTSKVFDKNALAHAQVLEAAGTHQDEIWKQTGTIRGAEGRWKQEISDRGVILKGDLSFEHYLHAEGVAKLGNVLDHPELYEAYPWAKDMDVVLRKGGGASYLTPNTIKIGRDNLDVSTLLHEIQHAIQDREGFAQGGSAAKVFALNYEKDIAKHRKEFDKFVNDLKYRQANNEPTTREDVTKLNFYQKLFQTDAARRTAGIEEAFNNYQRLAGEVESRNTETRALLTKIERRKISPRWTEDTTPSEQLVSKKPIWTTPYGMAENPMKAPIP